MKSVADGPQQNVMKLSIHVHMLTCVCVTVRLPLKLPFSSANKRTSLDIFTVLYISGLYLLLIVGTDKHLTPSEHVNSVT